MESFPSSNPEIKNIDSNNQDWRGLKMVENFLGVLSPMLMLFLGIIVGILGLQKLLLEFFFCAVRISILQFLHFLPLQHPLV